MEETKSNSVKVAIRCIFTRPITPNFLVINLADEIWTRFLWGDTRKRIDIVKPYLPRDCPTIREVSWIPLDRMSNQAKIVMIINLLNQ